MSQRSLEDAIQAAGSPVELARNSQIGPYVYPKVPAEFTNWRDEQVALAGDVRALRPVASHDRPHHRGPGRGQAALRPRRQHVQELRGRQGQAVRRLHPRRLRDRRRDPVLPRREPRAPRRAAVGAQLGAVPRRDRRLRRARSTATSAPPSTRPAGASSTASRCRARRRCEVLAEGERRLAAGDQVLQPRRADDRGPSGARAASRHVGRAGAGAVRPVGRGRGRSRRARRGRRASSGCARSGSRVYATNTLESGWIPCPLPAVFTGEALQAVPRVAARERLRGDRLARRQLLLGRHRRLLPDAVRSRLLAVREVRPRLHRPRGAREDGRAASAAEGDAGVERRGRRRRVRPLFAKGDRGEVHRPARCRTTRPGRTTRCCTTASMVGVSTFSGYSYNERSMLSLAVVDVDVEFGTEVTLVWGEEGGGSRSRSSSGTSRPRSARSSARVPYSEVARTTYAEGWRTKTPA